MIITWKKGEDIKFSEYFSSKEFENRTDDTYYISQELLDKLDAVREEFGKPINITSGYRSPLHNHTIGGSLHSTHMAGMAADISCRDRADLDRLYDIVCRHFNSVGDGRKRGFIHCDTRKQTLRWLY